MASRTSVSLFSTALLASTALVAVAEAAQEIGSTKSVVNRAYGTVPGEEREVLYVRDAVHVDERIQTTRKGGARFEFDDETELWVGEESDIVLDSYLYDSNTGAGEFVAELGTGLFRFVTGELQSEGFMVKTPVAEIGVRGTDFVVRVWAGGATVAACYGGSICIRPLQGQPVCIDAGQTATVQTATSGVSIENTPFAAPPHGVSDDPDPAGLDVAPDRGSGGRGHGGGGERG